MSRRVVVRVRPEVLAEEFFKPTMPGIYHRTNAGVPQGAKLVGCGYDFMSDELWFAYEHESFAEVPQGEHAPMFTGGDRLAIFLPQEITDAMRTEFEKLTQQQVEQYTAAAIEAERWKPMTPTVRVSNSAMQMMADCAQAELAKQDGDGEPTATVGG